MTSRASKMAAFCVVPGFLGLISGIAGLGGCAETDTGSPTPLPNAGLQVSFDGLSEGASISQTVTITARGAGGGGVSALTFTAPDALAGKDEDPSPDVLKVTWDTTRELNGQVAVSVEARGMDGSSTTKTVNLTRANTPAALQSTYEDGAYVRQGSPLIMTLEAAAFGPTPSLARIEARAISGGGLSPALPLAGTPDGKGGYTFNLGTPTSGTVSLTFNAINNDGVVSEPLILGLEVLRNDILSQTVVTDFEVTPDGLTGLLLGQVQGSSDLRLDFLNLADPANPAFSGASLTLQPGVTSTATGPTGNLFLHPNGLKAFVLFPSSKVVYSVDVTGKTIALKTNIFSSPRLNTGTGYQEVNRAPYGVMTPDGNYIFAWDDKPPYPLIMVRTSDMAQIGTNGTTTPFVPPATTNTNGFGLMTVHPTGRLIYMINNWGLDTASQVDLAAFDVAGQTFVDFNPTTARTPDAFTVETNTSSNKAAGQPAITKDGTRLLIPVCNPSTGATVLRRLRIDPNAPTTITADANVDLSAVYCGGIAAISPDDHYAVIASTNPNQKNGAIVDLTTGLPVVVTFVNGVKDAVFSPDSKKLFAESISFSDREMTVVDLAVNPAGVTLLDVPGAAGLVPPDTEAKLRYHLLAGGAAQLFQFYPAVVLNGTGGTQTLGTSLSVFSFGTNGFVFPNVP